MGYSPLYWGRQAWHFIHYVALNYPEQPTEEDKATYMAFIDSLHKVLPCPICGVHFRENLKKLPPRLENNKEFFEWSVDMHNEVNKLNDKREYTYEEAMNELSVNSNEAIDDKLKAINNKMSLLMTTMKMPK